MHRVNSEQPLLEQVNHIIIFVVCEIHASSRRVCTSRSTTVKMNYFCSNTVYIFVPSTDEKSREITTYPRIEWANLTRQCLSNNSSNRSLDNLDCYISRRLREKRVVRGYYSRFSSKAQWPSRRFIAPMATSESWSTCNWPRSIVTNELSSINSTLLWKSVEDDLHRHYNFWFRFNRSISARFQSRVKGKRSKFAQCKKEIMLYSTLLRNGSIFLD